MPTLATVLHGAGFHTAAFVSSYVLRGIDRAWRAASTSTTTVSPASGQAHLFTTVARADGARGGARWRRRGSPHAPRPYFLWVHFYDPHAPYDPPPAFAAKFPGRPYDGEVATSDFGVATLLDALPPDRRADTVIVATGDHGESLGEHGEQEHGIFLYDATLHVPLIIAGPGVPAGTVVKRQVRHVDILPTALALVGVTPPPGARRRESRRADDARVHRGGAAVVRGEPVRRAALRLERARERARRPVEVHQGAVARALSAVRPIRASAATSTRRARRPPPRWPRRSAGWRRAAPSGAVGLGARRRDRGTAAESGILEQPRHARRRRRGRGSEAGDRALRRLRRRIQRRARGSSKAGARPRPRRHSGRSPGRFRARSRRISTSRARWRRAATSAAAIAEYDVAIGLGPREAVLYFDAARSLAALSRFDARVRARGGRPAARAVVVLRLADARAGGAGGRADAGGGAGVRRRRCSSTRSWRSRTSSSAGSPRRAAITAGARREYQRALDGDPSLADARQALERMSR